MKLFVFAADDYYLRNAADSQQARANAPVGNRAQVSLPEEGKSHSNRHVPVKVKRCAKRIGLILGCSLDWKLLQTPAQQLCI